MARNNNEPRVIEDPRISLNALGEYLEATAGRRRTIIKDQKYQKSFITARYADAERAIVDFIVDGMESDESLLNTANMLEEFQHESDWRVSVANGCAEAIIRFWNLSDELPIEDVSAVVANSKPPKMDVAGVEVSVRPEILLINGDGNIVGAIKLYFKKLLPLYKLSDSDKAGKRIATVLHQYLIETIEERGALDHNRCYVVDVFDGAIYTAPRAYKQTMNDVAAACEEIAIRWPFVNMKSQLQ